MTRLSHFEGSFGLMNDSFYPRYQNAPTSWWQTWLFIYQRLSIINAPVLAGAFWMPRTYPHNGSKGQCPLYYANITLFKKQFFLAFMLRAKWGDQHNIYMFTQYITAISRRYLSWEKYNIYIYSIYIYIYIYIYNIIDTKWSPGWIKLFLKTYFTTVK